MSANEDIIWTYSNGADINSLEDCRGGASSGQTDIHEFEGTFTSISAAGTTRVFDSALGDGDDDHNDKYLMCYGGDNGNDLFISRIKDFVGATGEFILDDDIPNATAVGEVYRVFPVENLMINFTAQQSAEGREDHVGVYARQVSGISIESISAYIKLIDVGPFEFEILTNNDNGQLTLIDVDLTVVPSLTLFPKNEFSNPSSWANSLYDQPGRDRASTLTMGSTHENGSYIQRRAVGPMSTKRVVALLVLEGTSTSPAQQIRSALPIIFEVDGYTPEVTLAVDQAVHVGGGSRITTQCIAQETGGPVEDAEVSFALVPATRGALNDIDGQTDAGGRAEATYVAPSAASEVGNPIAFNITAPGASTPVDAGTLQSIELDGTEYLGDLSETLMGVANQFTLSIWARGTSSAGGTERSIFDLDSPNSSENRIRLFLTDDSNGSAFRIMMWDPGAELFKDYNFGSFTVNTWTLLAMTWDGTDLLLYQDAVLQGATKAVDINHSRVDTHMGVLLGAEDAAAPVASWVGQLYSFAIYRTIMPIAEIAQIESEKATEEILETRLEHVAGGMTHMWDFRDTADLGADLRVDEGTPSKNILNSASGVDGTNLSVEVPT